MNSPTISRLRTEWQALGTAPQSSTACHRLAECESVVDRLEVGNLAELVSALSLSSGRLSRNEAAEVITAMLRGAAGDERLTVGDGRLRAGPDAVRGRGAPQERLAQRHQLRGGGHVLVGVESRCLHPAVPDVAVQVIAGSWWRRQRRQLDRDPP